MTLGRQALLEPIEWTADGWFRTLGGDLGQPLSMPAGGKAVPHGMALSDSFTPERFDRVWRFFQPGLNEKTIAQLREDADLKRTKGLSAHPEVIAIQQKFSFPVACLVFALTGLALGLTVAREGKIASFVIGVVVIFAYYIVMFLSESLTKGHYLNMYLSRWMPNILLGLFGVAALIWRARFIDGRLPVSVNWVTHLIERVRARWDDRGAGASGGQEGARSTPLPAAGRPARFFVRR